MILISSIVFSYILKKHTDYDWLLDNGWWLLVVGCWLLVVGCWTMVVGWWLMVDGCWLLVVGNYYETRLLCITAFRLQWPNKKMINPLAPIVGGILAAQRRDWAESGNCISKYKGQFAPKEAKVWSKGKYVFKFYKSLCTYFL